jgi:adenylylsulfate kinase
MTAQRMTPVLVLTGPVGVGKTTVARALSELLAHADIAHAVIDLDELRWCYPSPVNDPFQIKLGLQNLAVVWASYRAAGAERLILVDIVETPATLDGYLAALPNANLVVVRLHAPVPTLLHRLEGREVGASLIWHQERAAELTTLMECAQVEDLLVDTENTGVLDIAKDILAQTGWVRPSFIDE